MKHATPDEPHSMPGSESMARPASQTPGRWPLPLSQGRVLNQQLATPSSSSTLPAFMRASSDGLSCPAGWFIEGGAAPSPPSRARELQAKGTGEGITLAPPPPPILPGLEAPCAADDPAVGVGDRCFVNIRADQPCGNAEDVGRTCFTLDKQFHFAFIAGASPCIDPRDA